MSEWFRNDPVLAMMYILAIPATVILVLQTILLLFGIGGQDGDLESDTGGIGDADGADMDADMDADTDIDGEIDGEMAGDSGLRLFTVRGMVAFFSVGGWAGISAIRLGANHLTAVLISLVMGIVALFLVALFFKWIPRIQHNGTLSIKNAVGSTGEVYITIPAEGRGSGKVNVIVQGQLSELTAVSYADRALRYGEKVRVTGTIGENTLVVEPMTSSASEA